MRLTVILPTLDERDNLRRTVRGLLDLPELEALLVVDDGSTDGTRELVLDLAARDPRVRLVPRDSDPGLARSLALGLALATTELVGWLDADGVIDAGDFARIVARVEAGADIAIGSRYRDGGRTKPLVKSGARDARLVTALSWALNAVILPALSGQGVHDYTSGIIVGRRAVLAALPLRGSHGEYFIELSSAALARGFRVEEVGYAPHARTSGHSKTAPDLRRLVARGVRYLAVAAQAAARARAG